MTAEHDDIQPFVDHDAIQLTPEEQRAATMVSLKTLADRHYGSDQRYRHGLMKSIVYTPGVQEMAELAGAYWLIDIVASAQLIAKVKAEPFQCWTLHVNTDLRQPWCPPPKRNARSSAPTAARSMTSRL
jgi:hypothetical protein